MGYSCAAKASMVHSALLVELQKADPSERSSNVWTFKGEKYMEERGRENGDGAITGTVSRFLPNDRVRRAGGYRIDPDGKIVRFPGSSKAQREAAEKAGLAEFHRIYGQAA